MLMPQPMKNTLTADTSAQKYFSWPRPNGCSSSGPCRPRTSPTFSSTWLPTSASEWIVSANKVGEPVTNQPKPLDRAITLFVPMEMETEFDMCGLREDRGQSREIGVRDVFPAAKVAYRTAQSGNTSLTPIS